MQVARCKPQRRATGWREGDTQSSQHIFIVYTDRTLVNSQVVVVQAGLHSPRLFALCLWYAHSAAGSPLLGEAAM